jgi:hypothetical protein
MEKQFKPELSFGDGTILISDRITGEFKIVSSELFYNRKGAI